MAENLAITSGNTADEVAENLFNQWKGSAEHNKTMLDASMTDIGVATQLLDNGQYTVMQDFGGNAQTAVTWNADQFNSTTIDQVGLTTDDIKQQIAGYGEQLSGNYYISDHIFKTKADWTNFSTADMANPMNGDPAFADSIWSGRKGLGNIKSALLYDANGNSIGWALYMTDMDETVQEAQADGLTTWIK